MKRLIKYVNRYSSDKATFSTCSTEYTVLDLVNDDFGYKELRELAKLHGLETVGNCFNPSKDDKTWNRSFKISEAIQLKETKQKINSFNGKIEEELPFYLGFISLPEPGKYDVQLPFSETPDSELPEEINGESFIYQVCNTQDFGVDDICEVNGELYIIMSGWEFYHILPLMGYSLESFYKLAGTEELTFYDEVDFCHECGTRDWRDNGYTYNFRIVDECTLLGLNCGCFDEFCKSTDGLESYKDNPDSAMEPEAVEYHEEQGNLKFLERFVGGMTDSWRHHSYDGKSVAISSPEEALKKYQSEFPDSSFVFCHDESGQFQTYFSIYKVES